MNILLVAQCSKKALIETRRILDQFAERKGDRTWQTPITQEGLNTLRKLLRKTAKRNTAVACHWVRGANNTELLWIVGNLRRFNAQGTVPTNSTQRDILRSRDENQWHNAEVIALLAGIAGLFHDFGKANRLFQNKLLKIGASFEPCRHEWVSLRLFTAFVAEREDAQWLQALAEVSTADEPALLAHLIADDLRTQQNPFTTLPPLAKVVAWLIVSHHRLPVYPASSRSPEYKNPPDLKYHDHWLSECFSPGWNSPQFKNDYAGSVREHNWQFPQGTPFKSATWCRKAQEIARRALQSNVLYSGEGWFEQRFTLHLSRLVLMLADHFYSAQPVTEKWQDRNYTAFANTDRITHECKQRLDEHNIGVAHNAFLLARSLPVLRDSLPAITRHKDFKKRATESRFRWQDKAYDLACALREQTRQQGFFGVNMASTGCGKTFANARIMYGLADETLGCRFSVALGLRTLTLQTGEALRDRLHLQDDDLAVMIGSAAVKELNEQEQQRQQQASGSESADDLFAEHMYVKYDGSLEDGRLSRWLTASPKLQQLLSAPILVSTIDHLIPATEGIRGGKQIAPMLRLLTSDLVLDEPDDFDQADLHALCRLVNWAGMLGSRVLLSSATLPPALIVALFEAYQQGWMDYTRVNGEPNPHGEICCAWVDEYDTGNGSIADRESFKQKHQAFVLQRAQNLLSRQQVLRKVRLAAVSGNHGGKLEAVRSIASVIQQQMSILHQAHHQCHTSGKKRVSIGLVRIANINPLVALASALMATAPETNYRIHYCVYHSQHPLAQRSHIETRLDAALTRYDPDALWHQPEIQAAIQKAPEENQLFVVLATSVAEVGRDHDYDWAIVEPSSMRSLVQLAGRVQRHRQCPPETENIVILTHNINALAGQEIAYRHPGFESQERRFSSHDLSVLLRDIKYQEINSLPCILSPEPLKLKTQYDNFAELEHAQLLCALFQQKSGEKPLLSASRWWLNQPTWHAEFQRCTPFRQSAADEQYFLYLEEIGEIADFRLYDMNARPPCYVSVSVIEPVALTLAVGNQPWFNLDADYVYPFLAERFDLELNEISARYGEIRLRKTDHSSVAWRYHPVLGVFRALE
ncbi:type I-F CRISPR-associated helicase Cas3f [Yersinia intermedia]|uniref:type I-F CRISPR-associated helicase Cas3f n=1 Tax=Yersinia intermedia TaxID=631 RepID=UPI001CFED17D|nr:type I-F CRISPR-associated helicase Cas3f [Yersinia intermedia]MCB5299250.1 type I-F CRISPR-associated helicase Cas3f [Yersinia intermedia]